MCERFGIVALRPKVSEPPTPNWTGGHDASPMTEAPIQPHLLYTRVLAVATLIALQVAPSNTQYDTHVRLLVHTRPFVWYTAKYSYSPLTH